MTGVLADHVGLQRGITYKSALLDLPGPVLLGLASIARDGGFRRDALRTYGGESPPKLTLGPGDLYVSLKDVTQSGDLLGAVSRVPADVPSGRLTQDTVKLLRREGAAPASFLYWLLRTPEYRRHCRSRAIGTTNLSLSREDFLDFPVPELTPARCLLLEVLDALEALLDLNRRMNKTLEAIAQALFRSWFVDFDPVRAKAEGRQPYGMDAETAALFPDAHPDGLELRLGAGLPLGWRAGVLGEVIDIFDSQRIPLSSRQRDQRRGSYPYYGAASAMDSVDAYLFDGIYVLAGEDGSVVDEDNHPVTQYVWGRFWVNNHAHVLRGRAPVCSEHVLLALRDAHVRPFVTGAVQPKLTQANLRQLPFVLAPAAVCERFGERLEDLFALRRTNEEQCRSLASLRDLLLPKLLSGELRVKDAESAVAAAV